MSSIAPYPELIQPPRPRGRPNAEDLVALEARLMAVSTALFSRHGYGATTMAEVARVARVSKTTLYSRFPSKAVLFSAILTTQSETWEQRLTSAHMDQCDTLEQALLTYADMALTAGMAPMPIGLNRLIFSESGRFPELAEMAEGRARVVREFLAAHIRFFAEREKVPVKDPMAAAALFQNLIMGWYSMTILANSTVGQEDRDHWLRSAVRIFLASRPVW